MSFPTRIYGKYGWEKQTHTAQRHSLGTVMELPDGREFKYALAGATALARGKVMQSVVPSANHVNEVAGATEPIGSVIITVTLGATAVTEDEYADGYLWTNDATGEGFLYRIKTHPAAASAADVDITLAEDDGLIVGLTVDVSEVSLYRNPYRAVIIHPSPPTSGIAGVAVTDVAASAYCWLQVKGLCAVLAEGTLVISEPVVPSASVDGAVAPWVNPDTAATELPFLGTAREVAATTEYALIDLNIA